MATAVASLQTDYAPATHECPTCGAVCKRYSKVLRNIRDIGLDGPVILDSWVGNYRCSTCRKFFRTPLPFAGHRRRYSNRAMTRAAVAVQQDKTTYTALPHRLDRDFSIRPSKSTTWAWFQEFAAGIDIESYLRWACSRFSGQISVDSVQDGDMQMWFATDPLDRDLILGYHRAEHANAETLTAFLTTLRDNYGIQPKLFTCDDATVFDNTPQQVWPDARVQLCHFHVIKNLLYAHLRKSLRDRMRSRKPIKPERPGKGVTSKVGYYTVAYYRAKERYDREHERWIEMFRKRRLFGKSLRGLQKPQSVERKEAEFIAECCKRYPVVATFRRFILDFYAIMDSKDAASAELLRQVFLKKWAGVAKRDEHIGHVVKLFGQDKWFAKLFPFTEYEKAHRTTNSTERANRWFRKRQKTHYRNRTEQTIRNMLHADLVYRRSHAPDGPPTLLKPRTVPLQQTA